MTIFGEEEEIENKLLSNPPTDWKTSSMQLSGAMIILLRRIGDIGDERIASYLLPYVNIAMKALNWSIDYYMKALNIETQQYDD